MNVKALLIGINRYTDIADLTYAENDAKEVAQSLKDHYGFRDEDIILMTSGKKGSFHPDRKRIRKKLADLCDLQERLDLLIIGFFGHGFRRADGERYLCGTDADEKRLKRTALTLKYVLGCVQEIEAATTVLFLDCCQNATGIRAGLDAQFSDDEAASFRRSVKKTRDVMAKRSGRNSTLAILSACSPGECAHAFEDKQHGVFTYYLLEALAARQKTASGCFEYISSRMNSGEFDQTPFFSCEGGVAALLPNAAAYGAAPNDPELGDGGGLRKKTRRNASKTLGVSLAVGALGVCAYLALNGDHKDEPTSVPAPVSEADTKTNSALPVEASKVETENASQIEGVSEANNLYAKALNLHVEAQELAAKKNYAEAIAKVKEAMDFDLTDKTRKAFQKNLDLYTEAAKEQSEKKAAEEKAAADKALIEALEQAAKDAEAKLAAEQAAKKAAEKKLADFEQAKKDADAAAKLNTQGKYSEAVAKLDSALKLLPVDEQYKDTRAQWEATRSKYDEAAKEQAAKALAEQRAAEQARKEAEREATEQAAATKAGAGAKAGDLKTVTVAGVEYRFRWCPAGSFMMGSDDSDSYWDEKPVHKVTLTKGFWLQETETTQEQWKSIMGNNPSYFKGDNLPVERVSWNDVGGANGFISRLNAKANGLRFRLPKEAEWEYASRGGENYKYSGSGNLDEVSWNFNNSGDKTHAVGTKKANVWGLHDMSGNVWEWCNDWYDENYYTDNSVMDPKGPNGGSSRVIRGGSWVNFARSCRCARRYYSSPEARYYSLGFRLVLESAQGK